MKFVDTSASSSNDLGVCKPDISGYDSGVVEQLVPIKADQPKTDPGLPKKAKARARKRKARNATKNADAGVTTAATAATATEKEEKEKGKENENTQSTRPLRYNANLGLADTYFEIKR